MLTEANLVLVHTDRPQEERSTSKVVAESLVVHNLLLDCLADGHVDESASDELRVAGEELQLKVCYRRKLRMVFAITANLRQSQLRKKNTSGRSYKVFDLGHLELAHAEETRSRRDLITERETNLRGGKRQLPAVKLEQFLEVDKDALGGLRAEVALQQTSRANLSGKHQVERERRRDVVAGIRRLALVPGREQ
jgi:hypothetical protein